MAKLPLEGVRIVAIPVVFAGPFGTMLLADLGAELILVESVHHFPPITRGYMPRPPQGLVPTTGATFGGTGGIQTYFDHWAGDRPWDRFAMFHALGRNKISCCMDLTRPEGQDVFKRLINVSDVFFESNAPATMEKLGLTYDTLKEVKEDLIYLRMPGLGCTGPHKYCSLFGAQLQALAGHTWLTGYTDLDLTTTQSLLFHCDASSGATAAFAILCALHYRKRTGKGQFIDLAQIETVVPHLADAVMDYTMNGRIQTAMGNRHPYMAPHGVYRCRGDDDWVAIAVSSDEEWEGFCRALGNPDWCSEERFSTALGRLENQDELDKLVEEWTCHHDNYEVMHILQKEGIAAGPVISQRDAFRDAQLVSRGFFEAVSHREAGTHLYPGMLWKMPKTPLSIRKPPPCLGEHNDYVFKDILGMSDEEVAELEKENIIGGDEYLIESIF
ncbi:MAG TPA: CoA transferase [Dehalococcoidia bacterium]|nr:CoA transferase [Dehalococcoidia bacterium]